MPHLTPPNISLPDVAEDDLRLGHIIRFDEHETDAEYAAAIVGFPSDAGVEINGGRVGAADGPRAIREKLYRLTPDARNRNRHELVLERTVDLGDVPVRDADQLEADQEALGETVASILKTGGVPIILGGGHETAFGHFLGHVFAGREVAVVNWDAHPDVRPLEEGRPHSGSPFRQMMTHLSGSCVGYTVGGLLPHQVSSEHVDWLLAHGSEIIWREELTISRVSDVYRHLARPTMVSFDLDAVDQVSAPGVSAPATGGLDVETWLHAAYEAGRSPAVVSMDVVELNPKHDVDGRTARLAALTVWSFLLGLGERLAG